ncbi:hypothetical protein M9980_01210 [Sphingomonas donggukensis]|uniref:ApeA N-terminal domain-containing protein n=1 Tax=Sphingomonas donggukensis TaxID=2949093 RepID=A0ABY4TWJ2_9SPHN|nr:hypothetical protein [Sphingomonas donggukensis]URW75882.1 hypothetical protein M9980_01210 [Sphingomonas donggukensis]
MPISQAYFELGDIQPLKQRAWIPLREITETTLEPPETNIVRLETWSGIATAAVERGHRTAAEAMGWSNGLGVDAHRAGVESWGYKSSDVFRDWSKPLGVNLVIDQHVEQDDRSIWHLHPDLVTALGLVREGDSWFRPEEGWVEVVRLKHDETGKPRLVEIRPEFLGDYLAARDMALYCSSYHERVQVTATKPKFTWSKDHYQQASGRDRREGIITEADYPDPDEHFWTRGALWRTEWVEAGTLSTRVRGDDDPYTTTFALKNDGTRATAAQLSGAMSWLYFEPAVVATLLRHRSARLHWFSQETGSLGATNFGVHFGVNDLGLITVFAKDIGGLAPWEQRLWSAQNVTPDGGVSKELFAAQMEVNPAATVAPEQELPDALTKLNVAFAARHGAPLLRDHDTVPALLKRAHRFVAAEPDGLLDLAKELTRLFAERIDVDAVMSAIGLPKSDKKPGSMKVLEKLIEHHRTAAEASTTMAPLFGIYDLRLADAHLGSGKVASGKARAEVVDGDPAAMQGRQLLRSFVDTLRAITTVLT